MGNVEARKFMASTCGNAGTIDPGISTVLSIKYCNSSGTYIMNLSFYATGRTVGRSEGLVS